MRKQIFSMFLAVIIAAPLSAVESTLIDFTTYNENIRLVVDQDQQIYQELLAEYPELDLASSGWPDLIYEEGEWDLENWDIELSSSASTVANRRDSSVRSAPSIEYGEVLGARLRFQPWASSFWAKLKTPFYINPTYPNGRFVSFTDENEDNGLAIGVLANVGQVIGAKSWIYGLNYDYTMGVRVRDSFDRLYEYGMGSVNYDGWRRLAWENVQYDPEGDWRNSRVPLYPVTFPYYVFDSIVAYKPYGSTNPDFFTYVRDVTMEYDWAVIPEARDIDDEAIWQVVSLESIRTRSVVNKILAETLMLKRNSLELQGANEAAAAPAAAAPAAAAADDAEEVEEVVAEEE